MRSLGVAVLMVTCLEACSTAKGDANAPLSPADKQAVSKSVDSAMRAYLDAVVARDADRVIAHYANDPAFMAYFDGTPMSYDVISRTLRGMFGGLSAIDLKPVTVQVTVLSPDAAIAGFTFRESFTDTAMSVSPLLGTASWTWVRRSDGWKIIHGDAVHLPDTVRAGR
jgi:ketosteroid isomerase-like protein